MRLWHLISAVGFLAILMTLARDPMSRVLLIVLATGIGEIVFGLTAIMALFQTIGAIGHSRDVIDLGEALAATGFVLTVGTATMSGWLFVGMWMIRAFV